MNLFNAYEITESITGSFTGAFVQKTIDQWPQGEVTIKVKYSSLNYKDILSCSGHRGITKNFPHVPGIDAAGIVEVCSNNTFLPGEEVIVTGFDLGMNTWGGFSEMIRVPSQWVVKKPDGLSLEECMSIGTAGFTAAQCYARMCDNGINTESGPILVTGSTGGVGSVAVALFSQLGFEVIASTRNMDNEVFLKSIGANSVINAKELCDDSSKPMLKSRWAGVVETVGGPLLETAIRSMHRRGVITFCGMIASPNINTTVYPFILRGLKLIGIDSAECPIDQKVELWDKLSTIWKPKLLNELRSLKSFKDLPEQIELMKNGKTKGRIVFKVS